MKKVTGICLCAVVLAGTGILAGSLKEGIQQKKDAAEEALLKNEDNTETTELQTAPELLESMAAPETYIYVIRVKDGVLMVYEKDGRTEYFETNIRVRDLEEKIVENLKKGIYFRTEEELYDFLESYSS